MTNENTRLEEAKAKTHEINQLLAELNSFVQSAEGISPLMQRMLEEKVDEILMKNRTAFTNNQIKIMAKPKTLRGNYILFRLRRREGCPYDRT